MKKTLLLVLFFMSVSIPMSGQLAISLQATESTGEYGSNTITRCYDRDHDITAYSLNGKTYIDFVKISTWDVYNRELAPGNEIYDLFIVGDELFFCGRNSLVHSGIIGHLHIPDMIMNTQIAVNIFRIDSVYILKKLVVNTDAGAYHVSAIGQNISTDPSVVFYNNVLIDYPDFFSPTFTYDAIYANGYEMYYDLLQTDRYIVCLGYDNDPSVNSLCYRKAERANIWANALLDSLHFFLNGNDVYSIMHSTAMDRDNVATSYFYMNGAFSYTRIRTIDVAQDVMTGSWCYTLSDKGEPTAMTFLHASKNLVVMQDFSYGGTYNSNFIQFCPFGIGLSPIIDYRPGELFQHITEHDSKYYLASGGSRWFWKDGPVVPTGFLWPSCPEESSFYVPDIRPLSHRVVYDVMNNVATASVPDPDTPSLNPYSFGVDCENQ